MASKIFYKTSNHLVVTSSASWEYNFTNTYDTTADLGTMTFEGDITYIPADAFNPSGHLIYMDLTSATTITEIRANAFKETSLETIKFKSYQCPTIASTAFSLLESTGGTIYYPADGQSYSNITSVLTDWDVETTSTIYNFTAPISSVIAAGEISSLNITGCTSTLPSVTVNSSQSWIAMSSYSNGKISLLFDDYNTGATRSSVITVEYNNYTYKTISISQQGANFYFNCPVDTVVVDSSVYLKEITGCTTNLPNVTVNSSESWVTGSYSSGKLTLRLSEGTTTRSATITIAFRSVVYKTITVTQSNYYFNCPVSAYTASFEDTSATFTGCTTNLPSVTVNSNQAWLTGSYADGTITLNFSENTGITRTATITITYNSIEYARISFEQSKVEYILTYTTVSHTTTQPTVSGYVDKNIYVEGTGYMYLTTMYLPVNFFSGNTDLYYVSFSKYFTSQLNDGIFDGCTNLYSVNLENISNMTQIPECFFRNCERLVSDYLKLPSGITEFGDSAFEGCASIDEMDISNLNSIGERCFANCDSLNSITCNNSTQPQRGTDCFASVHQTGTLYAPYGYGYENWISEGSYIGDTQLPKFWNLSYTSDYFTLPETAITLERQLQVHNITGCTTNVESSLTFTYPAWVNSVVYKPNTIDWIYTTADDSMDNYINTGIIPTTADTLDIIWKVHYQGGYHISTCNPDSTTWYSWRVFNISDSLYYDYNYDSVRLSKSSFSPTTADTLNWEIGNFYIKDKTTDTYIVSGATQSVINGGLNYPYGFALGQGYLKEYKITRNGIVIFYGKAALDNNKIPCLYDEISQTYKYYNGTQSLLAYSSSSLDGTLILDVQANEQTGNRTGNVNINYNSTTLATLQVTQKGFNPYFTLPETAITLEKDAQIHGILYCDTNVESGLTFAYPAWMNNVTYNYADSSLTLYIQENTQIGDRTGNVEINFNSTTLATLQVTQKGRGNAYFTLPYNTSIISSAATTTDVTGCSTNVETALTISADTAWLSGSYTAGTLTVNTTVNTSEDYRLGKLFINYSGSTLNTLYVFQLGSTELTGINFIPEDDYITIDKSGTTYDLNVIYWGASSIKTEQIYGDDGIVLSALTSSTTAYGTVKSYAIEIPVNTTQLNRNWVITFGSIAGGKSYTKSLYIKQQSYPYYGGVWKDVDLKLPIDTIQFNIKYSGTTIYEGRGFKLPDKQLMSININKICNSYLSNELPEDFVDITGGTVINHAEAIKNFEIYDSSSSELLDSYNLLFDYSYEDDWSGEDKVLSEPINNHIDKRMKIFFTKYNRNNSNINIEIND